MSDFGRMNGGRTRARTWDPLIKSQLRTHIYQAHFDIFSVRSGIEPERKLENVEMETELYSVTNNRSLPCPISRWALRGPARQRDGHCTA